MAATTPLQAEPVERRSERMGMAVTPSEKNALEKIAGLWPDKYDGVSSVLRDYTPAQAVEFVQRLAVSLGDGA